MTKQEAYLSSSQRRVLKFTEQGIANAKIIAKQFGCIGPALESFSSGLDSKAWLTAGHRLTGSSHKLKKTLPSGTKRPATIDQYEDTLGVQIQAASIDNRLGISEMENQALSLGHYAAEKAFTQLPSYIEPGHDPAEAPELDLLNNFYSPVISNHPEILDGDNTEGVVIDLHSRFAFTLANAALMIELEKRHSQGAIYVVKEFELAGRAQYNTEPFPQELLYNLIAAQSLVYNQSHFEID